MEVQKHQIVKTMLSNKNKLNLAWQNLTSQNKHKQKEQLKLKSHSNKNSIYYT
jgi:hypothetical protein